LGRSSTPFPEKATAASVYAEAIRLNNNYLKLSILAQAGEQYLHCYDSIQVLHRSCEGFAVVKLIALRCYGALKIVSVIIIIIIIMALNVAMDAHTWLLHSPTILIIAHSIGGKSKTLFSVKLILIRKLFFQSCID